ncbi:MAG: hypothetical protein CMH54_02485 [Myxococcales bacterium]|nr:hypothetical protein [Myxococcales bacterium]
MKLRYLLFIWLVSFCLGCPTEEAGKYPVLVVAMSADVADYNSADLLEIRMRASNSGQLAPADGYRSININSWDFSKGPYLVEVVPKSIQGPVQAHVVAYDSATKTTVAATVVPMNLETTYSEVYILLKPASACDADGDGIPNCAMPGCCQDPSQLVQDCNDESALVHLFADTASLGPDICNGLDDDCDGSVDEDPQPESCDGLDNDCNGLVDDGLPSITCGEGICEVTVPSCTGGVPVTCTPDMTNTLPEKCDGADNNCNGEVDEGLDGAGPVSACDGGIGVCGTTAATRCVGASWVCDVSALGDLYEPTGETLCDNLDNNCDGRVDEEINQACDVGCGPGTSFCANGLWTACSTPGSLECFDYADCEPRPMCVTNCPGPPQEVCNTLDDDCDGITDNTNASGCTNYYFDQDGDQYGAAGAPQCLCEPSGNYTALMGGDCDDSDISCHPWANEVCDGKDNDCANGIDDGLSATAPSCPLQAGVCAGSKQECKFGGWQACGPSAGYGANYQLLETSCDGVDNDCDGQVDESSVECEDYEDCINGSCQAIGCPYPQLLLNSTCDDEANTAVCNWDAGGCCKSSNPALNCNPCLFLASCNCLDPEACEQTGLCDCPYLEFSGEQYLEIDDEIDLMDLSDGDFTVQFWLRATEGLGHRPLLFWGDRDSTGFCLNRYLRLRVRNNNKVEAWLAGVDGTTHVESNIMIPSSNGGPDEPWQHVAIVRFQGEKLRVYVNNTQTDAIDISGAMNLNAAGKPDSFGHIFIGQDRYECGSWTDSTLSFIGDLYKVRFWNRGLSHNEIVVNSGEELFQFETSGMIGRYRMDTGCGELINEPGGPMTAASIHSNSPAPLPAWKVTQDCEGVSSP